MTGQMLLRHADVANGIGHTNVSNGIAPHGDTDVSNGIASHERVKWYCVTRTSQMVLSGMDV